VSSSQRVLLIADGLWLALAAANLAYLLPNLWNATHDYAAAKLLEVPGMPERIIYTRSQLYICCLRGVVLPIWIAVGITGLLAPARTAPLTLSGVLFLLGFLGSEVAFLLINAIEFHSRRKLRRMRR